MPSAPHPLRSPAPGVDGRRGLDDAGLTPAGLVIRPSDQRPVGWISNQAGRSFVGNDIYNSSGTRQTRSQNARRQETRIFYVRVFNDGNSVDTFTFRGTGAGRDATVRYRLGDTDVTSAMRSSAGKRLQVSPGFSADFQVRITVRRSASIGSLKAAKISATWRGDSIRTDAVRGVVKVVR